MNEALSSLEQMRAREGLHLANDLERRITRLESLHTEMLALAPTVVSDYRNKLRQRLTGCRRTALSLLMSINWVWKSQSLLIVPTLKRSLHVY